MPGLTPTSSPASTEPSRSWSCSSTGPPHPPSRCALDRPRPPRRSEPLLSQPQSNTRDNTQPQSHDSQSSRPAAFRRPIFPSPCGTRTPGTTGRGPDARITCLLAARPRLSPSAPRPRPSGSSRTPVPRPLSPSPDQWVWRSGLSQRRARGSWPASPVARRTTGGAPWEEP
ncbi:MAG: hypothetical protein FJ276_03560 [Planctomycetes bacterium]|nr:hypothetical protein [Planctomycetota bacterium]